MSHIKKYWISTDAEIRLETRNILNEYLLNLKLSNKAEATITKYKAILGGFLRDCPISLEQLHSDDVFKWLQSYAVNKKEKTMNLVLATL